MQAALAVACAALAAAPLTDAPETGAPATTSPSADFNLFDGSCPPSWTRVVDTPAECEAGALFFNLTDTTADNLTISDAVLAQPKADLHINCIVMGGSLFWNPTGSIRTFATPGVQTICVATAAQPPLFVLPPFLGPWDAIVPEEPPASPTPVPASAAPGTNPPATAAPATRAPVVQPVPVTPRETPEFVASGPVLFDVNAVNEATTDGACIEYETLNVADSARLASSTHLPCPGGGCPNSQGIPGQGFHRGRIDDFGWMSGVTSNSPNPIWYEMDAGGLVLVSGVVLQDGRTPNGGAAWVKLLRLEHSADRSTWVSLTADGGSEFFVGSGGADRTVAVRAELPVLTRYIRIFPETWEAWPSLRAGILRCTGRAVSIGGITLHFDQATAEGALALAQGQVVSAAGAFEALTLFGVTGYRQTLGRPDGFIAGWVTAAVYQITFTSLFDGRVDPLVAGFYVRNASLVTSMDTGAGAVGAGVAASVPFSNEPRATPLNLAEATPQEKEEIRQREDGGAGEDDNTRYVVATVVIALIILAGVLAFAAYRIVRRYEEAMRHRKWVQRGREKAHKRLPDGVASIRWHASPPGDARYQQSLPGSWHSPHQASTSPNPIDGIFPSASPQS
ncbi:hypothetical protein DIPPA_07600 [Diplonema papillatum]|nr:hypothetical protein DIPPA_07600 [Diplonema papillatum]